MDADNAAGHKQELRRGTVVLACLLLLKEPGYGYALLEKLTGAGFEVDANTLYPLLRRLEKQGLLTSTWNTDEPRPRKYYVVNDDGRELAALLRSDWDALRNSIDSLTKRSTSKPNASESTNTKDEGKLQ